MAKVNTAVSNLMPRPNRLVANNMMNLRVIGTGRFISPVKKRMSWPKPVEWAEKKCDGSACPLIFSLQYRDFADDFDVVLNSHR
jgi:hypothetical protein